MEETASKKEILGLTLDELSSHLEKMGQKSFRAKQIYSWLHVKRADSFEKMTNLSEALRKKLDESFYISTLKEIRRQRAKDGTTKLLFELDDKNTIEAVLMYHDYGTSLCVSTQVGCRMGCKFCASTVGGKVRDLSAGEMLSEVYTVSRLLSVNINKIVLMGIGEPLDNYQNVMRFLELLNSKDGFNMSLRHVSLSTCGIVPNIYKLADEKLQITLSVSLHAPTNETRDRIMPVNRLYRIEELMAACKYYFNATGRRISYEYALIMGVNDNLENAGLLAELLKGQLCHVNLIPVNPVEGTGFLKTDKKGIEQFRSYLEKRGFAATVRREMGSEIDAACGQLRQKDKKGVRPNVVER